jgi:hypothetical protein
LPEHEYTLTPAPECSPDDLTPFCQAIRKLRSERKTFYKDVCMGEGVEQRKAAETGTKGEKPEKCNSQPQRRDGWVAEAGIQVRFRAIWLRGGTRFALSDGAFFHPRFVAELGFGPKPKSARVH